MLYYLICYTHLVKILLDPDLSLIDRSKRSVCLTDWVPGGPQGLTSICLLFLHLCFSCLASR